MILYRDLAHLASADSPAVRTPSNPFPSARPSPWPPPGSFRLPSTTFTPFSQCSTCIALHHQARMIELAHRFGRVLQRREHVVQRARLMIRAAPRIGILLVVQHLVFEADRRTPAPSPDGPCAGSSCDAFTRSSNFCPGLSIIQHHAVLYAILHPAIAARRNLPVELHFEIAERSPVVNRSSLSVWCGSDLIQPSSMVNPFVGRRSSSWGLPSRHKSCRRRAGAIRRPSPRAVS